MTAREVERSVPYQIKRVFLNGAPFDSPTPGPAWDIEAMAEAERAWLQSAFNRAAPILTEHGEHRTLADVLATMGLLTRRLS